MVSLRISNDQEYHNKHRNTLTQETINVVAFVMGLKNNGFQIPHSEQVAEEDSLLRFIQTDEKVGKYYRSLDWAYDIKNHKQIHAPEKIHPVLRFAANKWIGKNAFEFVTDFSIRNLIFSLVKKRSVILPIKFYKRNHMVLAEGFDSLQDDIEKIKHPRDIDLSLINNVILTDPKGDFTLDYQYGNGNAIPVSLENLNKNWYAINKSNMKWAHVDYNLVRAMKKKGFWDD